MIDKKMFSFDETSLLSYTYEDFKELLALIPKIKEKSKYKEEEILEELKKALYSSKVLVDFDFSAWEMVVKIAEDDDFDLSSLNILDLCKLLTSVIENSKYIQGGILEYFEDGTILNILESIQKKFLIAQA